MKTLKTGLFLAVLALFISNCTTVSYTPPATVLQLYKEKLAIIEFNGIAKEGNSSNQYTYSEKNIKVSKVFRGNKPWSLQNNQVHLINKNFGIFISDKHLVLINNQTLDTEILDGTENTTNILSNQDGDSFYYVQNKSLFQYVLSLKKSKQIEDLTNLKLLHADWYEKGLPGYSGIKYNDDSNPSSYNADFQFWRFAYDNKKKIVFAQYHYKLFLYSIPTGEFRFVGISNQTIQLIKNNDLDQIIFCNDNQGLIIYNYQEGKVSATIDIGPVTTFKYLSENLIVFSPSSQSSTGVWEYGGMKIWDGKDSFWFNKNVTASDVILLDK